MYDKNCEACGEFVCVVSSDMPMPMVYHKECAERIEAEEQEAEDTKE